MQHPTKRTPTQRLQLQEQRRLGEILLEGAEERNRLRQVAYTY